jgi:2,5-diamino-6-(ribosylamino)-4(3H)-pyrimidinone 5'-phosphate reductase
MNRLHILVNVAMTIDGKIDSVARKGATISSGTDKARVDRLRAEVDAILVGGRTLIAEDPKLTVKSKALRLMRKARNLDENPAKVGVVSVADLKLDGDFLTAGPARRLIYTTRRTSPEQIKRLERAGAQVFILNDGVIDLRQVMKSLHNQGIGKLLIEGGGTLIAEAFRLELVDELFIYIAARVFGGASAPSLADGPGFLPVQAPRLQLESVEKLDDIGGILAHYTVKHNE